MSASTNAERLPSGPRAESSSASTSLERVSEVLVFIPLVYYLNPTVGIPVRASPGRPRSQPVLRWSRAKPFADSLADHDGRQVGIRTRHGWHDRRVGNDKAVHRIGAAELVHDCAGILGAAHLQGAAGMKSARGQPPHEVGDRFVAKFPLWSGEDDAIDDRSQRFGFGESQAIPKGSDEPPRVALVLTEVLLRDRAGMRIGGSEP